VVDFCLKKKNIDMEQTNDSSKLRYEGWKEFENMLQENAGMKPFISTFKEIHDYFENLFKELIIFNYTPNFLTIACKYPNSRTKTVVFIRIKKNSVQFEFEGKIVPIQMIEDFNNEIKEAILKRFNELSEKKAQSKENLANTEVEKFVSLKSNEQLNSTSISFQLFQDGGNELFDFELTFDTMELNIENLDSFNNEDYWKLFENEIVLNKCKEYIEENDSYFIENASYFSIRILRINELKLDFLWHEGVIESSDSNCKRLCNFIQKTENTIGFDDFEEWLNDTQSELNISLEWVLEER